VRLAQADVERKGYEKPLFKEAPKQRRAPAMPDGTIGFHIGRASQRLPTMYLDPTSNTGLSLTPPDHLPTPQHLPQVCAALAHPPFSGESAKFGILRGEVPHRIYALCCPAHLTVASARTQRRCSKRLCSNRFPRCCPSWTRFLDSLTWELQL
jgi:hypothetical protein